VLAATDERLRARMSAFQTELERTVLAKDEALRGRI